MIDDNFFHLIDILLTIVVVGVTIGLAYRQIKKQRQLAADRATLNFIADRELHNSEWRRIENVFFENMTPRDDPEGKRPWEQLLNPRTESIRKDALDVNVFLNHYELVAIGIKEKIINERLYRDWYKTSYVRIWRKARPYVMALRDSRGSMDIFCNLQTQAEKWDSLSWA